jgi:hypothetical protein
MSHYEEPRIPDKPPKDDSMARVFLPPSDLADQLYEAYRKGGDIPELALHRVFLAFKTIKEQSNETV